MPPVSGTNQHLRYSPLTSRRLASGGYVRSTVLVKVPGFIPQAPSAPAALYRRAEKQ